MSRKDYAIYAITKHGLELGKRLCEALPSADLYVSTKLMDRAPDYARELGLPMGPTLSRTWKEYSCHVHVISIGAVVRMIAPLLENKKVDPALVCVDDAARFSTCVLSGHVGRGNAFAQRIADLLDAQAVITTASDVRGTLTVDILGRDLGWVLDDPDRNVTSGCAAVVNEERVLFVQETGEPNWWPEGKTLPPGVEYCTSLDAIEPGAYGMLLVVSDRSLGALGRGVVEHSVIYRPKSLVVGIGCDRGASPAMIQRGIEKVLEDCQLSAACIRNLATIDVKGDEEGLVEVATEKGWELQLYPAGELDMVPGVQNPSEVVKKYVGTRSVGEAACLLSSGAEQLLVPKTKYSESEGGLNMTVALARIPFESRQNQLQESSV